MWARLRRRKKSREKPDLNEQEKKSGDLPKHAEHHYFKGHRCSLHKQTKFEIEHNRKSFWNTIFYFTAVSSWDIRARYLYRSYAGLAAETRRHYTYYPYSIHPYSRLRLMVNILSVVTIQICVCFLVIYNVLNNESFVLERLINLCEILYCFTIILNFFTGFEDGLASRYIVLSIKRIICNYISCMFLLDLVFVSGLANMFVTLNVRVKSMLAMLKMAIVPAYFSYTSNVLEMFGAPEIAKIIVNVAQIVGNYLLWNMTFQFALEYYIENSRTPSDPRKCSWLSITRMWNYTFVSRTVNSFNRAVGMLQQNANLNLLEQKGCFTTFFIISWRAGKFLLIHCILRTMVMFIGIESAEAKYFMMTKLVRNYLNTRLRVPKRLKKKILKFYAVRYHCRFFAEHHMMECVSGRLREDIIMHSSRQLLGEVEFLKHLPRSLILQISAKLNMILFLAGDVIFKINTVGDCLYFIDKGTVAIYSESGHEMCHLQDGDFFGEIALVLQPHFRTATVVAVTNCELFRLDIKDFESTIAVFPTVYEDIKKIAYERLKKTIEIDEQYEAELKKEDNTENQNMN